MLGSSLSLLTMEKALDGLWQRQSLILDNIANKDTPGYKAKRVDFESALAGEVERIKSNYGAYRGSAPSRMSSIRFSAYEHPSLQARLDGNNVDPDQENMELARTQIQYDYMVQKINAEYSRIKYAIREGR